MPRLITTLTPSNTPLKTSANTDNANERETANTIIETPKPPTAQNKLRPAWRTGGCRLHHNIDNRAPVVGAAFRTPSPILPTPRMSWANTGKRAIAPPNSTANRSSAIEPSMTRLPATYRTPVATLVHIDSFAGAAGVGRGAIRVTAIHAIP